MRKIHRLSKVITASTAILNTLCLVLLGPNTARALCDWSKKREFRLYSGQKAGSESPLRLALRRVGSWVGGCHAWPAITSRHSSFPGRFR